MQQTQFNRVCFTLPSFKRENCIKRVISLADDDNMVAHYGGDRGNRIIRSRLGPGARSA